MELETGEKRRKAESAVERSIRLSEKISMSSSAVRRLLDGSTWPSASHFSSWRIKDLNAISVNGDDLYNKIIALNLARGYRPADGYLEPRDLDAIKRKFNAFGNIDFAI